MAFPDNLFSIGRVAADQLDAVNCEIEARLLLDAEFRDMLNWAEDVKTDADKTYDLCPSVDQVENKLQILRQVGTTSIDIPSQE